jgi:hypothetical protein
MAIAYIVNPGSKRTKKKKTIKRKKLKGNPTPLLVISNPKKSKGGQKTMAKKKKVAKKNPKKHVAKKVNRNPKKHVAKKVKKHAKKAFNLNPKKHRKHAKKIYKINKRRGYKKNPDVMASIGDYGKQVGLGLASAIATVMLPPMALKAVMPSLANEKLALYAGEVAIFGGGAAIAHHLFKAHDWAGPILFGGSIVLGLQITADLLKSVQNYVNISGYRQVGVSGYGQLPTANVAGAIGYNSGVPANSYAMNQMYA